MIISSFYKIQSKNYKYDKVIAKYITHINNANSNNISNEDNRLLINKISESLTELFGKNEERVTLSLYAIPQLELIVSKIYLPKNNVLVKTFSEQKIIGTIQDYFSNLGL